MVRKRRMLYMIGQTRVHLDHVEGLGDFMELEVLIVTTGFTYLLNIQIDSRLFVQRATRNLNVLRGPDMSCGVPAP